MLRQSLSACGQGLSVAKGFEGGFLRSSTAATSLAATGLPPSCRSRPRARPANALRAASKAGRARRRAEGERSVACVFEDGARKTHVGGQALIEGVMMRGKYNWAVAVREPDGGVYLEGARSRIGAQEERLDVLAARARMHGVGGIAHARVQGA